FGASLRRGTPLDGQPLVHLRRASPRCSSRRDRSRSGSRWCSARPPCGRHRLRWQREAAGARGSCQGLFRVAKARLSRVTGARRARATAARDGARARLLRRPAARSTGPALPFGRAALIAERKVRNQSRPSERRWRAPTIPSPPKHARAPVTVNGSLFASMSVERHVSLGLVPDVTDAALASGKRLELDAARARQPRQKSAAVDSSY